MFVLFSFDDNKSYWKADDDDDYRTMRTVLCKKQTPLGGQVQLGRLMPRVPRVQTSKTWVSCMGYNINILIHSIRSQTLLIAQINTRFVTNILQLWLWQPYKKKYETKMRVMHIYCFLSITILNDKRSRRCNSFASTAGITMPTIRPPTENCLGFCTEFRQRWSVKCNWGPDCEGCPECLTTANVVGENITHVL